jgi:hypothetical protein
MIGHITIQLDGFLNLELNCEYDYEKAAPETDIDPPEQAVVELISAEINGQVVALNSKQWIAIEQYVYNEKEREF